MVIRAVGAELFHMDKRTDRRTGIGDEANSRFSKFWDASKNNVNFSIWTPWRHSQLEV